MKRLSFSFLILIVLSFILVQSCSTDEENTVAPVVQTPEQEPPAPTQYSLTVTAGEGGTVSTEGGTYDEGTELEITATPIEGYRFIGWEGNDSTSENLTVTLSSNQTLQAIFELLPIDSDGDGVTDSLDEFPFNSNLTEDLWGQIVDLEPELFFASDISDFTQEQFRNDLNLGIEEWGNYGPLEYWVLGNDINAAIELAELYCEKRTSRGELWYYEGAKGEG